MKIKFFPWVLIAIYLLLCAVMFSAAMFQGLRDKLDSAEDRLNSLQKQVEILEARDGGNSE